MGDTEFLLPSLVLDAFVLDAFAAGELLVDAWSRKTSWPTTWVVLPVRRDGRLYSVSTMTLTHLERAAAGVSDGLLILHHGRGADEHDLLGLADVLDPERRLHVVTPRGPLTLPGWPGYHWYTVPRVGFPDPATFHEAYRRLAEFHDETWQRLGLGPEQTVLGGFSMGAVMSYSLGLAGGRPVVAGILAFSGFIPTVQGWQADLTSRRDLPVLMTHGRQDPVIEVEFGRSADQRLEEAGLPVTYLESDVGHQIDPASIPAASQWLAEVTPGHASPP